MIGECADQRRSAAQSPNSIVKDRGVNAVSDHDPFWRTTQDYASMATEPDTEHGEPTADLDAADAPTEPIPATRTSHARHGPHQG